MSKCIAISEAYEADGRHDGHAVFSRAYVLFKTPEAVIEFRQAYDGHLFRSKTGKPTNRFVGKS